MKLYEYGISLLELECWQAGWVFEILRIKIENDLFMEYRSLFQIGNNGGFIMDLFFIHLITPQIHD